ncbi:unnamed protein product, partial [Iphiclides podalirius]
MRTELWGGGIRGGYVGDGNARLFNSRPFDGHNGRCRNRDSRSANWHRGAQKARLLMAAGAHRAPFNSFPREPRHESAARGVQRSCIFIAAEKRGGDARSRRPNEAVPRAAGEPSHLARGLFREDFVGSTINACDAYAPRHRSVRFSE